MKAFWSLLLLFLLIPAFIGAQQTQPNSPCRCPKFEVVSLFERVKVGETVEFEIASADPVVLDRKFNWTASAGKIISGQGTRKIVVQTTVEMLPPRQPNPSPLPPAGPGGYIFSGGIGRRPRRFTVTAELVGTNCSCRPISASMEIGHEYRETNKPADATDLKLSDENLTLPCEPGSNPREGITVSPSMVIDVGVTAHDPENDILTYSYTVSGGKIIGTGASVKWDLSGVYPGSYTITAGVDDGCGLCGKTQTMTVIVAESDCGGDCFCATVEIAGPMDDVLKRENVFTANVTPTHYDPTYEWSVDGGEIASGQGTPSISVKFDQKSLRAKTSVKVRIGGAPSSWACISEQELEYVNGRRKP